MAPVIQTIDLCKSYRLGAQSISVLENISFSVNAGEYIAIMGHSGAGKSTLLNILGCLDKPSAGDYRFNGASIGACSAGRLADIRNRQIGFVFQNFNLLPKLDVAGNVELPLIYGNVPRRERVRRVEELLKRMGLWERRRHKPNEISGGQKQRVAIARALVKNPSLVLADEPTGNLDSHTTEDILALLDTLNREGNTILMITHETEVAARAGRTLRLVDGKFAA
ncbi:MAG: ABC transporter ATP-binding protein [Chitinivibrionales bacterium]|nr:ABC transporter ATP-binding protein [Chitinivibrionales bacterium]